MKPRPSSAKILTQALNREGIRKKKSRKITVSETHSASIFLFKHILNSEDVRWRLAHQYAKMKGKRIFKKVNLENALIAKYGSKHFARRHRYSVFSNVKTITQLARALVNIEIGHNFSKKITEPIELGNGFTAKYERTKLIRKGKDPRGVTGCPEALHQLQLYKGKKYIGRIGFNFHMENGKPIITIANVQGATGLKSVQEEARKTFRKHFGILLVETLKELAPGTEFRGIKSAKNNTVQYRMTMRKEKIKLF